MATDLDTLMDLDPLELTKENIDSVIAIYRQRRAEREASPGKRAAKETGPKLKLEGLLDGMLKKAPPKAEVLKRRL